MNEADSQLLMRYIDGECTEDERVRVEERLKDDPQALYELDQLRQSQEAWQAMPPVMSESEVGDDWEALKKRILAEELPEDEPRRFNWLAWSQYWTWAAAAAVFALASIVFFLPRSDAPKSEASHNIVETVETDLDGATPIIFVDKQSGWSVVWVDEAAAG